MSDNELINIYATACYLQGYISVAHADDNHLNKWADRLVREIEDELTVPEKTASDHRGDT